MSFHLISFHLKQGMACFPGEQAGQLRNIVSRTDGCDRNRQKKGGGMYSRRIESR